MNDVPKLLLLYPMLLCAGLFLSILFCIWLGYRLSRQGDDNSSSGAGLIEGGVFALLGLLVALSFSSAVTRFDIRRSLLVIEANAIGTAQLRVDLLQTDVQPAMRDAFARYRQSRIDTYAQVENADAFKAGLEKSASIQREIWKLAVDAGRRPDAIPSTNILLIPALNEMFDITTTRAMALVTRTPGIVYLVMWVCALMASYLAGNAMGKSSRISWIHATSFSVVMTLALYVMIEIEYPRIGLVNLDSFVKLLSTVAG